MISPHLSFQDGRVFVPYDEPVRFSDLDRHRDALGGLGTRRDLAARDAAYAVADAAPGHLGERAFQLVRRDPGGDGHPVHFVDRPRVQSPFHLHKRYSGHVVSVQYAGGDGRRPAVFREKGRMDIQAAERGQIQDRFPQDLAERHHHDHVRFQRGGVIQKLRSVHRLDAFARDPRLVRVSSERRRRQDAFATRGTVRLGHGHGKREVMAVCQGLQDRDGENAGPHE